MRCGLLRRLSLPRGVPGFRAVVQKGWRRALAAAPPLGKKRVAAAMTFRYAHHAPGGASRILILR